VIDAYARRILGWRTATSMTTELVLDAIKQAIWTGKPRATTSSSSWSRTTTEASNTCR
jgi:putative transposase